MSAPRVLVLGTAQDARVPHVGCACPRCEAARGDRRLERRVASLGLVGASGRCLLVDATPDIESQMAALLAEAGRRGGLADAIVLTHAHVGHYVGLAFLGREGASAPSLPVGCTPSMARFLRANRPWSHLVERGEIALDEVRPGGSWTFDGVEVELFLAPHRSEDTDTVGLAFRGPERTLVYLPDTDVFDADLVERIRAADIALVDGTFWSRDELPHRDVAAVPHPFVSESVPLLEGGAGRVFFTHVNHTNALLDASPPPLPAGFALAAEGQTLHL